jgi:hypothetical protein
MRLFFCLLAPIIVTMLAVGCNTVDPGECWLNTSGGAGGGGTIPIGSGVGATSSGDFISPPYEPLDNSEPADNPCVTSDKPDTGSSGSVIDQEELMRQQLADDYGAGGVTCISPADCVTKCVAESKYCFAAFAVHPYKPELTGDLYQCIDTIPKAKHGGSYTCLYRYLNGDACIFAYGAKLGPITLPAPPPLCVYKK